MKKYLWMSLAALGFVACEKGIDNGNPQNGELEQSYVAITLAADGMSTRAGTNSDGTDGIYEDGTDGERLVKSAHVFFFDKNGAPFIVTNDNKNYVSAFEGFVKDEVEDPVDNVSDIQNAVLVIENRRGEHPTKMIAVLNWTPTINYSISELQSELQSLGNGTNGFVMSNAVYAQNGDEMAASIIAPENIADDPDLATKNPVKIYVERLAAKVTFNAASEGQFEVGTLNNSGEEKDKVFAQIKSWELYKDYDQSTLVKDIETTWSDENLGFSWNDASWNRSYWAKSPNTGAFASTSFQWNNTEGVDLALGGYFYCGENTERAAEDRTKVIIKAQLVTKNSDDTYSPVELSRWYATDYVGDVALNTAVANTLAHSIYSGVTDADGNITYTSIQPSDLKVVEANEKTTGTAIKAFEVFFQLSDTENLGVHKTWYQYADGVYTEASDDDINARLADVQPALRYKSGQTYYYTDIKHLGAADKTAEYGVVRNHVYKFNITGINGYGTPVFDGETDFTTPERPQDVDTYVAAEIKILSWRVVNQNQTLN